MRILGIIPSRYSSKRFPGKPLADIGGKSMVQRVYDQACQAQSLTKVVIATDDRRIEEHVKNFGGEVLMTSATHETGTDRCCEVLRAVEKYSEWDAVINIQGDEPFIVPEQIDRVAGCFKNPHRQIATLVKPLSLPGELDNPNIVKVVLNKQHEALYFSRAAIPHLRNVSREEWLTHFSYYKHVGIYGFRAHILREITSLSPGLLEQAESLEQLRWLEHGYRIGVEFTEHESAAVDTPEDLEKIKKMFIL